ncbi:MAG: hypothetical protein HY465_02835 [Deltaproteobacteria bacterium]|nr:hypothetical protein [Deltaproteobacteria bacterium]
MWCLGIVRRRWWRIVLVALTDILHGIDGQRAETVLRHGGRIMIGLTPYRIELPRRMPYELFVIPFVLATVLLMMRSSFDHTSPVATPSASSPAAIPKRESLLTEAKDWMAKGETIQARATLYQAKLLYPGDLQVEAFLQQIEGRDSP